MQTIVEKRTLIDKLGSLLNIKNKRIIGLVFVILSTLAFVCSQSFIKAIGDSNEIDSFHIVFWRSVIGLIIVFSIGLKRKRVVSSFKEMDKSTLRWLIIRGVVGATVMLVSFIGLAMPDTSLSEFGALSNINPVFAVIFAWIFLKEDLNWKVWLSLLIAIIGVFTVNSFSLSFSTGNILIILSAIGEGFVMVCIRKLKVNGVDSWLVVVPLLVFGLIITFPRVIFTLTPYSIKTICYLIAVGGASTLGQLLLTSAAKYVKARTISILGLLSVFELTLVDIVKGLGVTFPKIFGGLLIVLSSVIIIMISVGKNKSS